MVRRRPYLAAPGKTSQTSGVIVCTTRQLPVKLRPAAAETATALNPANRPHPAAVSRALLIHRGTRRERIAVVVGKRWPASGVRLTVGFLDNPDSDLRARIILHMNAWAKTANVVFTESSTDPDVRISRVNSPPDMAGYWSYVGTDIKHTKPGEATMNLESFTMATPESEYLRVVRHETGHTLGFPHEHMRRQLVAKIDQKKAFKYFADTEGWDKQAVIDQVLTPLEESTILGTTKADQLSIMCYQIPGSITKGGKPIIGGTDIDDQDYQFAASIYPKQVTSK
jgi:hypothetical protein